MGDDYSTKGSYGQPKNWAYVPWVGIFDNEVTTKSSEGFYLVYLFKADLSGFYLSLCLGTENFEKYGKDKLSKIHELSSAVREKLESFSNLDDLEFNIDLASDKKRPNAYKNGNICAKYYDSGNFPSDNELIEDLNLFLDLYKYAKQNFDWSSTIPETTDDSDSVNNNDDSMKINYWLFSPGNGAEMWDEFYENGIMAINYESKLGDLKNYSNKDEIGEKLKEFWKKEKDYDKVAKMLYMFANDIKVGDIIFAKKGTNEFIGRGIVESDYYFEKKDKFAHIRKVKWDCIVHMPFRYTFPQPALVNITDRYECYDRYKDLFEINCVVNSDLNYIDRKSGAKNILYYGVPGSGKSWTIKKNYPEDKYGIERVIFHPDYTYSDFIGQILPKVDEDRITYEFTPGPFTLILKEAFRNPNKEYCLIIEELNRGNAPAIFGDIFQLLDRKTEFKEENDDGFPLGTSEYFITNSDIANEIYFEEQLQKYGDKIKIPSNLFIIASMNTSDQNVFTLDTAFQRRWDMKLIRNDFDKESFKGINVPNTQVKWEKFWTEINELILSENRTNLSSEDKRLGAYFIRPQDFDDAERFSEKVFKYLWDDAFKFDRTAIFKEEYNSLEKIIYTFNETDNSLDIFDDSFLDRLGVKKENNTENSTKE